MEVKNNNMSYIIQKVELLHCSFDIQQCSSMLNPISVIYKFHVYYRGTRNKRITRKDYATRSRMNRLSIIPRQTADIP